MRNLFLALVLANLAFAAWHSWYADDARPVATPEREFGEIMLAREFAEANPGLDVAPARTGLEAGADDLAGEDDRVNASAPEDAVIADASFADADGDAGDRERAARGSPDRSSGADVQPDSEEAAEPVDPAVRADARILAEPAQQFAAARSGIPGGVCMSVGPFSDLTQVTTAAANLREDGFMPTQRAGEGEIWAGFWVYIQRIESVAVARPMLGPLHDAGLSDAYIIPDSDSGVLISLGIFSEIVRASRVREQVRELGYEATIADRIRRATVYWIDVNLPPGETLDFDGLQPPGRIVRLEQRPCEEVVL